ncbi:hypothetical protein RHGRI_026075 [Rhododendron griersonianum]|uniref:Exportin-4 n=1 Tax=Rhododendron griersonianum TaxID=479676 RepID=A0AAV6IST0_9ERIC|nr:hypothetical protein RHGRI_026075 [Rhododendron griersonianum]
MDMHKHIQTYWLIFEQIHVNPAAAEATILSLCQSPQPYQACQFILENSQVANARFQAAAAIRDAAIREWVFLTDDEKKSLIRLDFAAVEKEGFLSQVKQAVIGSHGLDVQYRGINVLESLVSEFSPSTSTAMSLPREFHEQCRASLEKDYLKSGGHCVCPHLLMTCSITDYGQMQDKHLLRLLSGIIQWVSPPDVIANAIECGKRESEMLDGCRALLAIATVTMPLAFDQLLKSIRGDVELGGKGYLIRYTWTAVLMPADNTGPKLPPEGVNAAANLFALIVESELKVNADIFTSSASASAFIDESELEYLQASITGRNERLSSYGLITRAAIDATIPLLTRLFSKRFVRLHECFLVDMMSYFVRPQWHYCVRVDFFGIMQLLHENARVFENMRSKIWEV